MNLFAPSGATIANVQATATITPSAAVRLDRVGECHRQPGRPDDRDLLRHPLGALRISR